MDMHAAARRCTWAIAHESLGLLLDLAEIRGARPQTKLPRVAGDVAVLPVYGMIVQRGSIWQEVFGGTATQQLQNAVVRAANDPDIKAVVFDVDSPGGTVAGVKELSDTIYEAQKASGKPFAAVSNSEMASAAYWIGSQVGPGRLFAAPGSDTGSIGVFRVHEDVSAALEEDGVKIEFIAVPEYKTEANPYQPLTDEAREHHMEQVAATYEEFVADVARGRRRQPQTVKTNFGKGRTFNAAQAAEIGLVDRVATLSQVIAELGPKARVSGQSASDEQKTAELCEAWNGMACETLVRGLTIDESRRRRIEREKGTCQIR